jgi:hypothetical protein
MLITGKEWTPSKKELLLWSLSSNSDVDAVLLVQELHPISFFAN